MQEDYAELRDMVLQLSRRCDALEAALKNRKPGTRRLVIRRVPRMKYSEWLDCIPDRVQEHHLLAVFDVGHLAGLDRIIADILEAGDPLTTIGAPRGWFLVCDNGWDVVTERQLKEFTGAIAHRLVALLVRWQGENAHRLSSDSFAITFAENINKAIGGHHSQGKIREHVRRAICRTVR